MYRLPICLFFAFFSVMFVSAQEKNNADHWHGFLKQNFRIDTTTGYLVVPEKPLPGNPWLWRTYSPEFHIEIDSILVSKGFHIGFINVNPKELYGQPDLLLLWEKFYAYLINNQHMHPKPALSGAVRGSLCAFAWAKKHPDQISCLYAENPVSEIKSWPGGRMKGVGATADQWKQLLASYHFTEMEALNYADNPKDNLSQLAALKVPFYFSFGLKDAMIPMEENAWVIAEAYVKLGGPVTLHPMTIGKQEQNGHHVTIENPGEIADFIIKAAVK